eukprot:TRINITY_DN2189_c0_g1_i2.p1 TRINITY_DN2189_c0_g1~~TRINITY_DN2189_c0_g1_i2.p1  ORF type:complete len:483 (+),score=101.56 TRINITY_DN2189_c0_g1_i2:70-1518(+)
MFLSKHVVLFSIFLIAFCVSQVIIEPQWLNRNHTTSVKTVITLQVVVNPLLVRGNPVHDACFQSLADTRANLVRFVPWLPYPRLGVAELKEPTETQTFWNFTLIDPIVEDFMRASGGRDTVINFSTTPNWMWNGSQPKIPEDPLEPFWGYESGNKLINDDFKKLGEYYGRLVSWYTKGGFTDELGVFHKSGKKYRFSHWEVLNEVEAEHGMTPEYYTKVYDAIVSEIRKVDPTIKFVGMALEFHNEWNWYEYFLDPKNHESGIPIDYASFHFYSGTEKNRDDPKEYDIFFPQVDIFVEEVKKVIKIRDRVNPKVKLSIDEIGTILPGDNNPSNGPDIPESYWRASGAMFAYIVGRLAPLGIDILGQSQLTGYPTQYPSVTLLDWNTGTPNAKLRIQMLLNQFFSQGDMMVETPSTDENIFALGVAKKNGKKFVLVINKVNEETEVTIDDLETGILLYVDQTTGGGNHRVMSKVFFLFFIKVI